MANIVQLKRSSVAGKVPDTGNVSVGEPVVNLVDKKVYTKNGSGDIVQIAAGNLQALADVSNTSPTTNQVLAWNGSLWAPASAAGITVTVASTPPVSPASGDIWINSTSGKEFLYFNDGTSTQWVEQLSGSYVYNEAVATPAESGFNPFLLAGL